MVSFPDFPHIERIRRALWCGRAFGRAAVMVGSGFSRNATPTRSGVRPFPLWKDLAAFFLGRLGILPTGDPKTEAIELARSTETSRALRLAEEFQVSFTRSSLDEELRKLIADDDYRPGDLHRRLVQLPWADVFTTNYDTLLERAARGLVGRRYDVVRAVHDIPTTMRPRIVKLHGSFPSNPPYVITEEDFRTYPRRFAPFVNLVQQAIMENTFCLLGFGGDDPNFLSWSGWVRDNLGTSAPRIYLCGVLDLTEAQRLALYQRYVVPLDLGPLFPAVDVPAHVDRKGLGLEWLLLHLEAGMAPDPLAWPYDTVPTPQPSSHLAAFATAHGVPLP